MRTVTGAVPIPLKEPRAIAVEGLGDLVKAVVDIERGVMVTDAEPVGGVGPGTGEETLSSGHREPAEGRQRKPRLRNDSETRGARGAQ